MNHFKLLLPKMLWFGTIGVATMLLGWTPSCKAQEVSPAHFTQTGVEDVATLSNPAFAIRYCLVGVEFAKRSMQEGGDFLQDWPCVNLLTSLAIPSIDNSVQFKRVD